MVRLSLPDNRKGMVAQVEIGRENDQRLVSLRQLSRLDYLPLAASCF